MITFRRLQTYYACYGGKLCAFQRTKMLSFFLRAVQIQIQFKYKFNLIQIVLASSLNSIYAYNHIIKVNTKVTTNTRFLFNHHKWFVKCLVMAALGTNNYSSLKITLLVKKRSQHCAHKKLTLCTRFCSLITQRCVQTIVKGRQPKVLVHDLFTSSHQ